MSVFWIFVYLALGIIGFMVSLGCILLCVNVKISDEYWEKCYEEKFGNK